MKIVNNLFFYQGIEIPQSKIFLFLTLVNCEISLSQIRNNEISHLSAGLVSNTLANFDQVLLVRWSSLEQDCSVHLCRVQSL